MCSECVGADQLLLLPPSETGEIDPVLIDRYNTPGFVGCLSRVTLNGVAPLKAALRPGPAAALVTAHGILVPSNCGAQPLTISPLGAAHDPWQMDTGNARTHARTHAHTKVHRHEGASLGGGPRSRHVVHSRLIHEWEDKLNVRFSHVCFVCVKHGTDVGYLCSLI